MKKIKKLSDINNLVYQEKGNVQEKELFTSPYYAEYLWNLVKGIAEKFIGGVKVIENAPFIACTDSKDVRLGYENILAQKADSTVKKHKIYCGLTLHEVGHILFTNFDAFEEMMVNISKGKYPISPTLFNELGISIDVHKKIMDYFLKKAGVYIPVTIFKQIENSIEDGFVDRAMMLLIPGYGKSLVYVREVDETIECINYKDMHNFSKQNKFASLLLSLSRHDKVCFDETDNDDVITAFEKAIPVVRRAVNETNSKQRLVISYAVFALLLDLLARDKVNQQQQNQSSSNDNSNNSESDETTEQNNPGSGGSSGGSKDSDSDDSDDEENNSSDAEADEAASDEDSEDDDNNSNGNNSSSSSEETEEGAEEENSTSDESNSEDTDETEENGTGDADLEDVDDAEEDSTGGTDFEDADSDEADEEENNGDFSSTDPDDSLDSETNSDAEDTDADEGELDNEDSDADSDDADDESNGTNSNSSEDADDTSDDNSSSTDETEEDSGENHADESEEVSNKEDEISSDAGIDDSQEGETSFEDEVDNVMPDIEDALEQLSKDMPQSEKTERQETPNNTKPMDSLAKDLFDGKSMEEISEQMQELEDSINEDSMTDDSDLSSIREEIAQEKVAEMLEKEIKEENEEFLDKVQLSNIHRNISCIFKRIVPTENGKLQYQKEKAELDNIVRRFLKDFLKEIRDRQLGDTQNGLYMGKRISGKDIYRHDKRIFSRNIAPEDIPDMAIVFLLDISGSMYWDGKLENAKKCAYITYKFCKTLHIPCAIIAHTTDDRKVVLYDVAEPNSIDGKDCERIFSLETGECNRDGYALRFCMEKLDAMDANTKIMFVTSDGQPNHYGYGEEAGRIDVQECVKEFIKKGIKTITAGIGVDAADVKSIYTKDASPRACAQFLDISDLEKMPKAFIKIIKNYLQ